MAGEHSLAGRVYLNGVTPASIEGVNPAQPSVRMAEAVAVLCLTTDLAMGQPLEHGLRRALLAVWLGEELGLSERQVEVLRLAVRGLTNRQIGEALFVSPKTVGHHIQHIYDKIGVSTRVGATLFALQHGLAPEAKAHQGG